MKEATHKVTLPDRIEPGDRIAWETVRRADLSELVGRTILQAEDREREDGLLFVLDNGTYYFFRDAELLQVTFGVKRAGA